MHLRSVLLTALASIAVAQDTPTLVQALNSTSDLSALNGLISGNSSLAQTLASLTNFTILAPNNAAINNFTAENNASLANPAFLTNTLLYHVLTGAYANFTETTFVPTALAPGEFANVTGGQVVEASVADNGSTTFLSGYALESRIVGDPVTVQNGVVYIIDRVLTLPADVASTGTELGLTSLIGAVTNASLAQTLVSTGDITVFAPNNAAFQAIGSVLSNITAETLASVLEYHVVAGSVLYSTDLTNTTVSALAGGDLTVTVVNSTTIYVNNARVVTPNILIANGVVHVIDEVLNPSNTSAATDEPQYPGATSASSAPFTEQAPSPTRSSVGAPSGGVTSTSAPGAAWQVKPTGVGAALLAGVLLAL